jgi:transcriptional regulator with XRE-family HTH domain
MPINPMAELRRRLKGKTQLELAAELGVTAAHISDILSGRRAIGDTMLAALGLERVTVIRPIKKPDTQPSA